VEPLLISLRRSPPPGFEYVAELSPKVLARRSFCLLVPDAGTGGALLAGQLERALGLVICVGDTAAPETLGPLCRKLTVMEALLPWLREFALPQIACLEAIRAERDVNAAQALELQRHQRDHAALAHEYLEFRNSLLKENAERRRAEAETAAANELYRSVFRAAVSHAIIGTDTEGVIDIFSEGAELILGYSAGEIIGKLTPQILHDQREIVAQAAELGMPPGFDVLTAAARRGEVETREWTYIRKDGTRFPVLLSVSAKRDSQGKIVGFLGVATDITERKRAEEEVLRLNRELEARVQERTADLTRSNAIIRATLESTAEGIIASDLQGRITWFNERVLCILRIPESTAITSLEQLLEEVFLPQVIHPAAFLRHERELLSQAEEESFDILEFKDGRVLERCSRRQRIGEQSVGRVWSYRDITERRALENQLQQSQKLEAVGQLASGIAHELNTPAQFVGDNIRFVQDSFQAVSNLFGRYRGMVAELERSGGWEKLIEGIRQAEQNEDLEYLQENVPAALDQAGDGISRMAAIVQAMKDFAHPDSKEPARADLNRAIQTTLMISRNEYKYVADVVTELNPIPPLLCHIGELNQVFLNLIVNAAHAIHDRVRVEGGRGRICVRTLHRDGVVKVEIEDTGSGIPEAIRARVFDPFFTTKEVGRGSGQGLAIARAIVVNKHHGKMSFRTEIGKGTTFTVELPYS
jgi:PAS domain S-box-containing protein